MICVVSLSKFCYKSDEQRTIWSIFVAPIHSLAFMCCVIFRKKSGYHTKRCTTGQEQLLYVVFFTHFRIIPTFKMHLHTHIVWTNTLTISSGKSSPIASINRHATFPGSDRPKTAHKVFVLLCLSFQIQKYNYIGSFGAVGTRKGCLTMSTCNVGYFSQVLCNLYVLVVVTTFLCSNITMIINRNTTQIHFNS